MFAQFGDEDTICALSTPPGVGGIAVIRVSGPKALALGKKVCSFLPATPDTHRIYFGTAKEIESAQMIDEILCSYFAAGKSFTGEETLELSCHGGKQPQVALLKELIKAGCRLARKGEFTYRAFMNGRLDLVQAEGVLGLIESQSRAAAKMALRQLKGDLSEEFAKVEDDLTWILAHLEASIDFSTEGIEVVHPKDLLARSERVTQVCERLISSYETGRLLKDGLLVALVGRPNVGKSSLLNVFVNEDRAIVTAEAGTTRDTIEGEISINGVRITFVDTAGIRDTDNEIEKLGIERSRKAMNKADLVFFVSEADEEMLASDLAKFAEIEALDKYLLVNKVDKNAEFTAITPDFTSKITSKNPGFSGLSDRCFFLSAKSKVGIDDVMEFLKGRVQTDATESSAVITQARHVELLQKIHSCLVKAISLIKEDESPEFVAFELQEAIRAIHEILGKEFNEQVIERIFKEFCIGK